MKYISLPYNCVPKLKYELKLNKNYLGCFGILSFLVKLFSRRFWVKSKADMFVSLWSCGFLARRVFDKMIFYVTKRCPLSFQVPSIQRLSAGAVGVVLRCKIVWSSACENSLLWEIFKQYEMLMWYWLPAGKSSKTVTWIITYAMW